METSEVAQWMAAQVEREGLLYQETAAWEIQKRFGDEFVYDNENGNLAISRPVLRAFRKLTEDEVVWERGERLWRKRESSDPEGRRQVE